MTEQELFDIEHPAGNADYNPIQKEMDNATITVISKQTEIEVQQQAKPVVEMANALTISNQSEQIIASEKLKEVKGEIKKARAKLDPICDAAHKAHKANTDLRSELISPFQEAEKVIKQKLVTFMDEEEEKARKKQAELDAKARREEEKRRKELEERAEKWEEKGNEEKADMLRDEAEVATVAPQVAASAVAKVQGISISKVWKWEITDINALPHEYLIVNEQALNAMAKALKDNAKIPGVRIYSERSLSAKA